ncbi:hypothetical protein RI367_000940 [Sorochytrium milnesiophthora]
MSTIPPPKPGSTRALTRKDIQTARGLVSFPVQQMSLLIHGSQDVLDRRDYVVQLLKSEPVFSKADRHSGSREQRMLRSLAMSRRMIELRDHHGLSDSDMWVMRSLVDETTPTSLHEAMFLPALRTQCSEEQARYWIPLAEQYRIIGCYAQTELAHGSNLSGLETTATYIPQSDEFELHSPDITASKWWIGSLGVISTHAVVQAKLILNGKDYGPHPFVVPLRSLDDHKPFPGVVVGDIGPKMGFNMIDNGFLMFDKYRVPRDNLLMRFAKVTNKGEYVKPPHAKLAYSAMVYVRTNLVRLAGTTLAKASTIAIRYACVRRQFNVVNSYKQISGLSSDEETPVIMYPMVQHRMFPRIAEAYACLFAAQFIEDMYNDMIKRLETFDVSTLPVIHANSSALKSYCTGLACDGIEELRRACGGHGFMMSSGLPYMLFNYAPNVTYEGENYLLTQQTARYLLKQVHKYNTQGVDALSSLTAYLDTTPQSISEARCTASAVADWFNPTVQLACFAHRAARLVHMLAAKSASGVPFADLNVECARVSLAHSQYLTVLIMHQKLRSVMRSAPSIYPVLKLLSDIYALSLIERDMGDFTEDAHLSYAQATLVRAALKQVLGDCLHEAVGLVDAWRFSDYELDSAIGRSDGQVYEALFERALQDPINRGLAGNGVPEGYEEYIRPLLKGERNPVTAPKLSAANAGAGGAPAAAGGSSSLSTKAKL